MTRHWAGHLAIFVCVVIALGVAANRFERAAVLGAGPLTAPATVVIAHGTNTEGIGRQLQSVGAIRRWWLFELAVQVLDRGRPVKAGEYAFVPAQSLSDVIQQMRDGRTVVHHLTIPEGLTVSEILALIDAEPALAGAAGMPPPEGSLMPDTYNFSLADSRAELVSRMRHAMDKALAETWETRAPGLSLADAKAALVLASIVEKETGVPQERTKIAAVFMNRLGRGMKLQSDPTVIYALTQGRNALGRPLVHADLAVDSPFNSYQHEGLPPTPIACPGREALHAVAHPESNGFLYFVADGTGGHAFAETLDEHNRNVTHLRQLEGRLPPGASNN